MAKPLTQATALSGPWLLPAASLLVRHQWIRYVDTAQGSWEGRLFHSFWEAPGQKIKGMVLQEGTRLPEAGLPCKPQMCPLPGPTPPSHLLLNFPSVPFPEPIIPIHSSRSNTRANSFSRKLSLGTAPSQFPRPPTFAQCNLSDGGPVALTCSEGQASS